MKCGRLCMAWAVLLTWGATPAQAQQKAPEAVLKEKGLTKVGAAYLLEADAKLAESLRRVRAGKLRVDEYAAKRAAIEKKIHAARDETARREAEHRQVKDEELRASRLELLMRDSAKYLADREKELAALPDPRDEYIKAVLEVSAKMEAAATRYAELAADESVTGALAQLNAKGAAKVRLGPSPQFTQQLPLIRQQRDEIDTGVVELEVRGRVARVNVSVNGKVTRPMLLESGASMVTLPWDVAKEAGALPTPKDPSIRVTIPDGSQVEGRIVRLASVQMGPYAIRDVECAVLLKAAKVDECLLGGSFLKHFVYRADTNRGELHVSRIRRKDDGALTDAKDSPRAGAGKPVSGLKELTAKLNDVSQWQNEEGKWSETPDGRLRGEGPSVVRFGLELGEEVTVSWRMRLVSGSRARVLFDGTGTHFGSEGFDDTLAVHGGKDLTTQRVKFERGREYAVSIRFDKDAFECRLDGKLIATGKRSKSGPITLRLSAGDGWSPGATEYWGFELSAAGPPAGDGGKPGTSIFDVPPGREGRGVKK